MNVPSTEVMELMVNEQLYNDEVNLALARSCLPKVSKEEIVDALKWMSTNLKSNPSCDNVPALDIIERIEEYGIASEKSEWSILCSMPYKIFPTATLVKHFNLDDIKLEV